MRGMFCLAQDDDRPDRLLKRAAERWKTLLEPAAAVPAQEQPPLGTRDRRGAKLPLARNPVEHLVWRLPRLQRKPGVSSDRVAPDDQQQLTGRPLLRLLRHGNAEVSRSPLLE